MNKDQRRFLIIVLLIAFGFAADRLVRFYYEHAPVANEGECLKLKIPGRNNTSKGVVVSNNFDEGTTSLIIISTSKNDISSFEFSSEVPNNELRDIGAQRISCDEKVD